MSNFPGVPLSNISGERANFGGAFRRVDNELIPYSSAADTFNFDGRDLIIKDSVDTVNLRSLFAYIGATPLADELGSAGDAVLGANVTATNGELIANGIDPQVYISSFVNGLNFSIVGRIRFDATADSNIDIMTLSNSTNSAQGSQHLAIYKFNNEIRFEIEDDTDVRNFVIANDTDVLSSSYITYWIIRNGNQIRVIIENIFDNIWGLNAQNVMYNLYMFAGNGGSTQGRISTNASINETLTDNEINNVTALINQNPDILVADFIVDFDFTVRRTMNMDNKRITNMAQPELAGDAANKAYVDNATGGSVAATQLTDNSGNVIVDTSGGVVVQVSNKKIAGVLQPVEQNEVANRAYVDTKRYTEIVDSVGNVIVDTDNGNVNVDSYVTTFKDIGDNKKGRTLSNFMFDWVDGSVAYIVLSSRENPPEGLTSGSLTIRGSGRNRDVQAKDAFTAEVTWRTEGENTGTRGGNFKWTTARSDIELSLIECEFDGFMSICVKILATGASGSGIRAQISLSGIINSDTFIPSLRTDTPLNEASIANSSFNFDSAIQVNAIDTRSGDEINFADNTLINIHTAQFNGQADAGLQPALLRLTQGQSELDFNEAPQISFGYNGGTNFQHFITTTHNSGPENNSIHIFTCNGKSNNTLTDGSNRVWSFDNQENRSYKNLDMEGNNILGATNVTTSELTTGEITSSTATLINAGSGRLRMTGSGGNFYFQTGDGTYQPLKLGVVHNSTSSKLDIDSSQTVSKQVLNMDTSNKIINLAEPDNGSDAATKNYVDTTVKTGGGKWRTLGIQSTANIIVNEGNTSSSTFSCVRTGTGQYTISIPFLLIQYYWHIFNLSSDTFGSITGINEVSGETDLFIQLRNVNGSLRNNTFFITFHER